MFPKDLNILIVDDMAAMRRFIVKKCQGLGLVNFIEAENGREAWDIIKSGDKKIEMVISDINMPEMSGIECLINVRNDEKLKNIPYIIVSAERESKIRREALDAGTDGYLTKPFKIDDLKKELEKIFISQKATEETVSPIDEEKIQRIKKDFFGPIFKYVNESIYGQCNIDVKPLELSLLLQNQIWKSTKNSQIVSSAFLHDKKNQFTVLLYFEEEALLKYASSMFDEEYTELDKEIRDLPAEWLNISLGHAKEYFNDRKGYDFVNSIPTIFTGNDLVIKNTETFPIFVCSFSSTNGNFHLLLNVGPEQIIPWDNSLLSDLI